MNYVTLITQISQMFSLRILGFRDLRKPGKTLACAACSTSILYGTQSIICVSKPPQLFA